MIFLPSVSSSGDMLSWVQFWWLTVRFYSLKPSTFSPCWSPLLCYQCDLGNYPAEWSSFWSEWMHVSIHLQAECVCWLLNSAATTSLIKISESAPEAAVQAVAQTLPLLCLTDEVLWFGWTLWTFSTFVLSTTYTEGSWFQNFWWSSLRFFAISNLTIWLRSFFFQYDFNISPLEVFFKWWIVTSLWNLLATLLIVVFVFFFRALTMFLSLITVVFLCQPVTCLAHQWLFSYLG